MGGNSDGDMAVWPGEATQKTLQAISQDTSELPAQYVLAINISNGGRAAAAVAWAAGPTEGPRDEGTKLGKQESASGWSHRRDCKDREGQMAVWSIASIWGSAGSTQKVALLCGQLHEVGAGQHTTSEGGWQH